MPDKPFLARLLDATGMPREELRRYIGLTKADMAILEKAARAELPAVNLDPFWTELVELVDDRIGKLMAVKMEIAKLLDRQRQRQAVERARVRGR